MTFFELIRALRIPRSVRRELLALLRLSQRDALAGLENLIGELVSHRRIYESKRKKQLEHRIIWGRELEESIQRYLSAGKCLRTAKILAGRAYCVLDDHVLTFYYDNKLNSRPGLRFPVEKSYSALNMPQWYFKRSRVRKVVFDRTFATFKPPMPI